MMNDKLKNKVKAGSEERKGEIYFLIPHSIFLIIRSGRRDLATSSIQPGLHRYA